MSSLIQSPPLPTTEVVSSVSPLEWWEIRPELIPSVEDWIIEDGAPVDNRYFEKLWGLLADVLYASWVAPGGQ